MPSLSRPSRPLRAAAVAALLLASALVARDGLAATSLGSGPGVASNPRNLAEQLAQARMESDAAEETLDSAKRVASPGHLLDPLPASLMAGLGDLQAQYAEMERKAAGYRATLGDQHPTLKGAEEVLAELRGQILDGARRAVAQAQQDATRARATVASLERQARGAEATGSIAAPTPAAAVPAAARPPSAAPVPADRVSEDAPGAEIPAPRSATGSIAGSVLSRTFANAVPLALRHPWVAAAAGLLAGAAALGVLIALFRPRRRRRPAPVVVRIEPAAPVEALPLSPRVPARPTSAPAAPAEPVPVLAMLPLQADDDPARVQARLDREADSALAIGAASVFTTLAAAAGAGSRGRVCVVVTAGAGAPAAQAGAASLALAAAAAGAGRRVLLIDDQIEGGLGRALAPGAATIAAIEAGGRMRHVLRVVVAEQSLAVLTRDAEATTIGRPLTRLPNLDGFDAIVIAGQAGGADFLQADLALVVAPRGADAADLAAAARTAAGDAGRPCGVLLVAAPIAEVSRPAETFPSRRRTGAEAGTARLGLRRTFDPVRRAATRVG